MNGLEVVSDTDSDTESSVEVASDTDNEVI